MGQGDSTRMPVPPHLGQGWLKEAADDELGDDVHDARSVGGAVGSGVAGTRSGRTFRVRGHGVPASSGAGDLLVTVEVVVPEQLTEAQREAVEALAAASAESPRRHLGVE